MKSFVGSISKGNENCEALLLGNFEPAALSNVVVKEFMIVQIKNNIVLHKTLYFAKVKCHKGFHVFDFHSFNHIIHELHVNIVNPIDPEGDVADDIKTLDT